MDLLDNSGSCDDQKTLISFEYILMLCISLTPVAFLLYLVPLNHWTHSYHSTINEHDRLLHNLFQVFESVDLLQWTSAQQICNDYSQNDS